MDLWGVSKDLFGLRQDLKAANRERRKEIADFFSAVSRCLAAVYEQLMSNEIPHGRCAELATYADTLPKTVEGVIDAAEASALSQTLRKAHNVERLWYEGSGAPNRLQELPRIAEASGVLAALAESVRGGMAGD